MKYHCAMSIDYVLHRCPQEEAGSMFNRNGVTMTATEVYAHAAICQAQGFEVIPPCDNHDAKGYCCGHEEESEPAAVAARGAK